MNRTAALDRDRAAPSSPASTANRMTATESLLPEIINDFFNKIGTELPCRRRDQCSEGGGRTDSTRTCRHGRVGPQPDMGLISKLRKGCKIVLPRPAVTNSIS